MRQNKKRIVFWLVEVPESFSEKMDVRGKGRFSELVEVRREKAWRGAGASREPTESRRGGGLEAGAKAD